MVDIKKLTEKDIGRWVLYLGSFDGTIEEGKIKSWNNKYIFVVYKCANEWGRFKEYTGVATKPEDLEFMEGTMSKIKLLEECSVRKGGHNELPTRPRPKTPPKGQGGGMSKYLEFKIREEKAKTKVIEVISMRTRGCLGFIMWFGRWRQYAFFPQNETVFNVECLNDITSYIRGLR